MSEQIRNALERDIDAALIVVLGSDLSVKASVRARALLSRDVVTAERALDVLATILSDAGIETEYVDSATPDLPSIAYYVGEASRIVRKKSGVSGTAGNRVLIVRGKVSSFLTHAATPPEIRSASPRVNDRPSTAKFSDVWPFIRAFLGDERSNIAVVIAYSIVSSLLGLVVPLTAQAVVNSVALGVFSGQLLTLSALVAFGLVASGMVGILERWVVEIIQRRIFVHTSFSFMQRILALRMSALREQYAPELVNRFFDVITIQKSVGKILLEGTNAVLVLFVGLVVLAAYHPLFLLYDAILVAFLPVIVYVLGRGGIGSAILVSKHKYAAVAWLEEVARAQLAFKITGARPFAYSTLDAIAASYVADRRRHFAILVRQMFGSMLFKSAAAVGVLAIGGMLVIDQQMSLGQLVAAELVIIMILNAVEKLINQLDMYYDLVAAVDKVAAVVNQPIEDVGGLVVPSLQSGGTIDLRNVWFTYDGSTTSTLRGASLFVPSGGRVSLIGRSGSGKTTLLHVLLGLERSDKGTVFVNGIDIRIAELASLRARFGLISPNDQILDGTIEENILLGRPLAHSDLQWAMNMACVTDDILALPDGLSTVLRADGHAIPFGMQRRILFARMIVHRPEILLLDEAFDGIEDVTKRQMLEGLVNCPHWTIINLSHDSDAVRSTESIYVIDEGRITLMRGEEHA